MKPMQRILAWLGLRRSPRASFAGAEVSRLTLDWIVSPVSADKEVRKDIYRLRARARDLAKNSAFVEQYLSLLVGNVIGPRGMKMQAQVRNNDDNLNKPFNDKIEAAWSDWSVAPSTDGQQSLVQFEHLALRTVAMDGEVFIRVVRGFPHNPFGFALQFIDADLIDHELNRPARDGQNEIRMGVELDTWRRPVAYWAWNRHQDDDSYAPRTRVRYPASDIIHLYDPRRANQTRGYTWIAPVMLELRMLDGYVEAELVAARTAAAKMGFIVNKEGTGSGLGNDPNTNNTPVQMDASPGNIEELPVGSEFQGWDPQHPTAAFPDFIKAATRRISTGLRVSYNALANDLENVNYSSIRSGLLIERDQWKLLQQWWIDRFRVPVYRGWLEAALLSNQIVLDSRDPRKFHAVKWQPRGWQWVDPLKDVQASTLAIENRLDTRSNILGEKGLDYEETLEQLADEEKLAREYDIQTAPRSTDPSRGNKDDDDDDDDNLDNTNKARLRAIR